MTNVKANTVQSLASPPGNWEAFGISILVNISSRP
jgi:hypothetical protein